MIQLPPTPSDDRIEEPTVRFQNSKLAEITFRTVRARSLTSAVNVQIYACRGDEETLCGSLLLTRAEADMFESLLASGPCLHCGRWAPLVEGECPDCRH